VSDDLVQFLTARLDEIEAVAVAALADGWKAETTRLRILGPEQLLREVEAKRRIVELADGDDEWAQADDYHGERGAALDRVLHLLALPYADHPEFQEAWKP
jgi:hypothetical protein